MDVSYDRAYGGQDTWAEKTHPDPLVPFMKKYSSSEAEPTSGYAYPRNPTGRGYLVYPNEEAFAELKLPNLENPNDLLTPERLCIGDMNNWHLAPVPVAFDWISVSWFPRVALLGATPKINGKPADIPEVRSGLIPMGLVDYPKDQIMPLLTADHMAQFCRGSSPSLRAPTLSGNESILLQGFHRHAERIVVTLPKERPRMYMAPPLGEAKELQPALKTIVIDTEENRLVNLWAAQLVLDRPLTEAQQEKIRHSVRWSS
jgi:hypothetical protein